MALLDDIEAFLATHEDISATALGDRALGDRHFVRQLRLGRRVWPETEEKVRAFMAEAGGGVAHACGDAAVQHGSSSDVAAANIGTGD